MQHCPIHAAHTQPHEFPPDTHATAHAPRICLILPNSDLNPTKLTCRTPSCAPQVRTLASIIAKHPEDGCADITTRQSWQLRGIQLADLPDVMSALSAAKLMSVQSGLDNVRNTVGNPLAGIDPEEIIDTRPLTALIDRYITNDGKVRRVQCMARDELRA